MLANEFVEQLPAPVASVAISESAKNAIAVVDVKHVDEVRDLVFAAVESATAEAAGTTFDTGVVIECVLVAIAIVVVGLAAKCAAVGAKAKVAEEVIQVEDDLYYQES